MCYFTRFRDFYII